VNSAELLRKATLTATSGGSGALAGTQPSDFGGSGQAALSIEQVTQFLELMAADQVMLPDVRTVTSNASKWQESIIQFGSRIARPGVEATRLADVDRKKPRSRSPTKSWKTTSRVQASSTRSSV
jgi:hypothetical protein